MGDSSWVLVRRVAEPRDGAASRVPAGVLTRSSRLPSGCPSEGRRIECARDLRQRLALIHLKPRPWQQTRELLEKALDVRFRKISDAENRWILERDPEVVRIERQRRERLAKPPR
jgi:hypothetical protein